MPPTTPPHQIKRTILQLLKIKNSHKSILAGTFAGALVSWIPGVTASIGTLIAYLPFNISSRLKIMKIKGTNEYVSRGIEDNDEYIERYIAAVSGVSTSTVIFSLLTLWVIGKPRSGVLIVVEEIFPVHEWGISYLLLLMGVVLIASFIGYLLTITVGIGAVRFFSNLKYVRVAVFVVVFLGILSLLTGGLFGLSLYLVGTLIGIVPQVTGTKKSNCMGLLLVPMLLSFLDIIPL